MITSDGVNLFVKVKGEGRPCLYLHGGPGSGSYWMEKFSAGLLERHFQMIYLDQRGAARSSSPADGNYSMERMAQDCEEVRAALGISQWLTMGHSFGGLLQIGYAQRFPRAILGMVMLNCTLDLRAGFKASWVPKACEFLGIADTRPYLDESVPDMQRLQSLADQLRESDLFWKMAYASKHNEELMSATFDEIPNWNHDNENSILSCADYWQDFSAISRDIHAPVLYFYGKLDWMVGPEHYRRAQFPELMLWPSDVGHVAIMENRQDLDKALDVYREKYNL